MAAVDIKTLQKMVDDLPIYDTCVSTNFKRDAINDIIGSWDVYVDAYDLDDDVDAPTSEDFERLDFTRTSTKDDLYLIIVQLRNGDADMQRMSEQLSVSLGGMF